MWAHLPVSDELMQLTNVILTFWDMNFFLVWFLVQSPTDRCKARHMSPPCICTGGLKKRLLSFIFPGINQKALFSSLFDEAQYPGQYLSTIAYSECTLTELLMVRVLPYEKFQMSGAVWVSVIIPWWYIGAHINPKWGQSTGFYLVVSCVSMHH